jgi:hypothetical protein
VLPIAPLGVSLAITRPHSINFVISSIDAAKDFAKANFGNVQHLFTTDRTPRQRSNVKDSIRKKKYQKASNRQCSHLEDRCSCVSLANQT